MPSTVYKAVYLDLLVALLWHGAAIAAPADEDFGPRDIGDGPYDTLIITGALLIDGLGAPAQGPMDVYIEGDRIVDIQLADGQSRHDETTSGENNNGAIRVIDAHGKYVLPGFINAHGHLHSVEGGRTGRGGAIPSEYVTRLWLAHGITSVREVGNGRSIEWVMDVTRRAAANEITSPRIYPYVFFGARRLGNEIGTVKEAREYVRRVARAGAHGIKFFGVPRRILEAAIEEARDLGLKTTMHHEQTAVVEANVDITSGMGLDAMEHWYGLPESLFTDRVVQDYSPGYNYNDEQDRFAEAGRLWAQAAAPGSEAWRVLMDRLLARDFHIVPTMSIYIANRDWSRARRDDWHDDYTLPQLWDFFRPSPSAHGSYWFDWTQDYELSWATNFRIWMQFLNDYKNRGGLVGVGEDAGYIYSTYGFGLIREMELLREAGFHPLEVIRATTIVNARILGVDDDIGSVEIGKKADLVVVPENPLRNLKTLYATGHLQLDADTGDVVRVGGVDYTIRDGIVYDGALLRAGIRAMVAEEKKRRGLADGYMPIETKVRDD